MLTEAVTLQGHKMLKSRALYRSPTSVKLRIWPRCNTYSTSALRRKKLGMANKRMHGAITWLPDSSGIIRLLLDLHMALPHDLQLIELTDANFFLVRGLLYESKREGHELVQKTIDDWNNNANKFDGNGEKLWGLLSDTELVGIGGLNRDPYTTEPNIGRVRHLYIRESYRRKGLATLMMKAIVDRAQQHFAMLRLFTGSPVAAEFYETLGFQKIQGYKVTHALIF
jgi:GNAT superfamily N-acetyltransferase